MLSDDDTVLYCNIGFAKMLKAPMEKIVGVKIETMICPTYIKAFEELLSLGRTRKGAVTKEITLQGKDILVPTLMSISSLQSDTIKNTFLVVTDLSEHMDEEVKRYTRELELAQIALSESEHRWATTLASIGDALIATDKIGKIKFMNGVAEKLTGWTLNEASKQLVQEVFKIVNESTRKIVDDPVSKVIEKGITIGLANHTILIRKDGTEVAIDDSGAPIKDKDGKTTGVVLIFRDITDRKRTEKQIENLARFPSENPYVVIRIDFYFKILYANPSSQQIARFIETKIGERSTELWDGYIKQALRDNAKIEFEEQFGQITFSFMVAPVVSEGYVNIYGTDITERKKAEEALRKSEQNWLLTVSSIGDALIVIDNDNRITYLNSIAESQYETSREEATGAKLTDLYTFLWVSKEEEQAAMASLAEKGFWKGENIHIKRNGGRIFVDSTVTVLKDSSGKRSGLLAVIRDITERKKAERELDQYRKNLEHLVEERTKQLKDSERLAAIGATAGMVGHDIRNPLQGITSDVYLAKTELASTPNSEEKERFRKPIRN